MIVKARFVYPDFVVFAREVLELPLTPVQAEILAALDRPEGLAQAAPARPRSYVSKGHRGA